MNINKVTIAGNITRDPELKATPGGASVASMTVAVNRTWKDQSGQLQEDVMFADVTAFGKTADIVAQHLKKGNPIYLEGRLKLDKWDDKKTGEKKSKLRVIMESFQFVGSKQATAETTKPERQKPTIDDLPAIATTETNQDDIPF